MYKCLYCNELTSIPVLVHVIETGDIIPMCSIYCASTLEECHDCIIVDRP